MKPPLSIAHIATAQVLAPRRRIAHKSKRQLWNEAAQMSRDNNDLKIDLRTLNEAVSITDVQATVQERLDESIRK